MNQVYKYGEKGKNSGRRKKIEIESGLHVWGEEKKREEKENRD